MHNLLNRIKKINNQKGFTLIEILVALFLIALVMGLAISNPFNSNGDLENETKNIERAIRYIGDESAFRNTITRIHFYLSKEPQQYSAEYGPSGQFVLPALSESNISSTTKEEDEQKEKQTKELNQKFGRLTDFSESNLELNSNVKIIAVGSMTATKLQTSGEFSLYAYPSGEKDEAFIVLQEENTLATVSTFGLAGNIEHNYYHLDNIEGKDINDKLVARAKELFEEWQKKKH
jgi:prepilin-type N-terminal cleavage/methylation domain-containing protein